MGIGRREFLQIFGATIASLSLRPQQAVAVVDDQYLNRKLGLAFLKPAGWAYADVMQMGEIREGQILQLAEDDPTRDLFDTADLPIVSISPDTISVDDGDRFSPGITVFLHEFELLKTCAGAIFEVPPGPNLEDDIDACASMLKKFSVTKPVKAMRLSDCPAAEYTATFVYEHKNMLPTPVRMRTVGVAQGAAFYILRMFDAPAQGPAMTIDYNAFLASVRIV